MSLEDLINSNINSLSLLWNNILETLTVGFVLKVDTNIANLWHTIFLSPIVFIAEGISFRVKSFEASLKFIFQVEKL